MCVFRKIGAPRGNILAAQRGRFDAVLRLFSISCIKIFMPMVLVLMLVLVLQMVMPIWRPLWTEEISCCCRRQICGSTIAVAVAVVVLMARTKTTPVARAPISRAFSSHSTTPATRTRLQPLLVLICVRRQRKVWFPARF